MIITGDLITSRYNRQSTFKSFGMYCRQAALTPTSPAKAFSSLIKSCFSLLRSSATSVLGAIILLLSSLLCSTNE